MMDKSIALVQITGTGKVKDLDSGEMEPLSLSRGYIAKVFRVEGNFYIIESPFSGNSIKVPKNKVKVKAAKSGFNLRETGTDPITGDISDLLAIDEKQDRDYKEEYRKYGKSKKAKKYRAELNKYNRDKGTYGNGDGKDASHKGGKIAGFEDESVNRGRREKSRKKGYKQKKS